jgi:hypothetical protein
MSRCKRVATSPKATAQFINKVNDETLKLSESLTQLNTNFHIFMSQFNPNLFIDTNADGSYDLNQRESIMYSPLKEPESPIRPGDKYANFKRMKQELALKEKEFAKEQQQNMARFKQRDFLSFDDIVRN